MRRSFPQSIFTVVATGFAIFLLSFTSCNNDESTSDPISNETALWLLKQARARLEGKALDTDATDQANATRPSALFITAFSQGRPSRSALGKGTDLAAALEEAIASIASSVAEPDRIQIDIIRSARPLNNLNYSMSVADLLDPGVEGISIETEGQTVYLLPSEMIYRSLIAEDPSEQKAAALLNRAMQYLELQQDEWRRSRTKLSAFRTHSFVEDHTRTHALRLVRSSVFDESLDRARLMASALSGGDYLVRSLQPDGRFQYIYDPLDDDAAQKAYNMVRHAGAAISLIELYAATRNARYLEAAGKAIAYLKTTLRPARAGGGLYVLDRDGKAKLGAAALALLALARQAEVDSGSRDLGAASRIASFITEQQHEDGSFESYYPIRGDEPHGDVSLYYPGEAMMGLVKLFALTKDKRLLDSARRGADYLIRSQREMSRLPPDAWLMQALEELYLRTNERRYAEHALALAEGVIEDQYAEDAPEGFAGGYRPGMPRSTPASARGEGLVAALRLARLTNDERARKIESGLRASIRFQLSHQFDIDNSFFLSEAARSQGGVRASFTSARIRIDYVQHHICSLLGAAKSLD